MRLGMYAAADYWIQLWRYRGFCMHVIADYTMLRHTMHSSHWLRVAGHNSSSKISGIGVWKIFCTSPVPVYHPITLARTLLGAVAGHKPVLPTHVLLSQEIMSPSLSFLIISQEEDEDQTVVPSTVPATGTFQFAPATQTLPAGGFSF